MRSQHARRGPRARARRPRCLRQEGGRAEWSWLEPDRIERGTWRIESVRAANEAMQYAVRPASFAGPPARMWQPESQPIEEPALVAVSLEQFEALWRIDLLATDEPAGPCCSFPGMIQGSKTRVARMTSPVARSPVTPHCGR